MSMEMHNIENPLRIGCKDHIITLDMNVATMTFPTSLLDSKVVCALKSFIQVTKHKKCERIEHSDFGFKETILVISIIELGNVNGDVQYQNLIGCKQ